MAGISTTTISVSRADVVRFFCSQFEAMGAPVERLLEQCAIPPQVLDIPGAVIPLGNAYRFAQLACSSLHSEHLGLYVGLANRVIINNFMLTFWCNTLIIAITDQFFSCINS